MENENEKLVSDHDYDGIQEYDNPLPFWWLVVFFGTIIFGFHYWLHYTVGGGQTQLAELKHEMQEISALQAKSPGVADSEETFAKLLNDQSVLNEGQAVFAAKCAVCHGPELQGLIGPNLTDDYWIHGKGKMVDIAKVVRTGVADKGMPGWEGQLPPEEVLDVIAFVKSKHGSNPKNPKAPQGDKIEN